MYRVCTSHILYSQTYSELFYLIIDHLFHTHICTVYLYSLNYFILGVLNKQHHKLQPPKQHYNLHGGRIFFCRAVVLDCIRFS